jgi:hypothetical protein
MVAAFHKRTADENLFIESSSGMAMRGIYVFIKGVI